MAVTREAYYPIIKNNLNKDIFFCLAQSELQRSSRKKTEKKLIYAMAIEHVKQMYKVWSRNSGNKRILHEKIKKKCLF